MCMGSGGSSKTKGLLSLAALAAAAYFTGGASLGATGAGASAGSSVAGTAAAGLGSSSAAATGLSSVLPSTLTATLGSGAATAGTGLAGTTTLGSLLTGGASYLMNNPSLIGQGLNAAGVLAKNAGYNERMDQYNSALKGNLQANKALQTEASKVNNDTLQNFTLENQNAAQDAALANRMDAIKQTNVADGSVYLPTSNSAPTEVQSDISRLISDRLDNGRRQQAASAKLNSLSDLSLGNALTLDESARKINQLQNFAGGNTNTLNTALTQAQIAGRKQDTLGDLLQGAGNIANVYSINKSRIR